MVQHLRIRWDKRSGSADDDNELKTCLRRDRARQALPVVCVCVRARRPVHRREARVGHVALRGATHWTAGQREMVRGTSVMSDGWFEGKRDERELVTSDW